MLTAMLPGLTTVNQRASWLHAGGVGRVRLLKSTGFRQENRITQLFGYAQIAAVTGRPAALLILTLNPLATKSIPNVLREVLALRFGRQKRFVDGPRALEITIDIAFLESQVQLSCVGSIRRGCEHARLQRHPLHCIHHAHMFRSAD
jgi:hypothetical protein